MSLLLNCLSLSFTSLALQFLMPTRSLPPVAMFLASLQSSAHPSQKVTLPLPASKISTRQDKKVPFRNIVPKLSDTPVEKPTHTKSVSTYQSSYTLIDLGTLGGTESGANAINQKGEVVGWSDKGGGSERLLNTDAFLWSQGVMRSLSLASSERPFPGAFAINDRGQVLVKPMPNAPGTTALNLPIPMYGLLWDHGKVMDLHTLMPCTLTNKGLVVVSLPVPGSQKYQPGVWRNGVTRPLAPGVEARDVQVCALNDNGEFAGTETGVGGVERLFLDHHGEITFLDLPSGFQRAEAKLINSRGQVVIVAWSETGHASVFFWQPLSRNRKHQTVSKPMPIRLEGLGGEDHWAYGLSNSGQVVGSSGGSAFLWNGKKTLDLNTLIPGNSGWKLREATGINDKGQICGNGLFNDQKRAFLLTPVKPLSIKR